MNKFLVILYYLSTLFILISYDNLHNTLLLKSMIGVIGIKINKSKHNI